jgi:DinB superfamily
MDAIALFLDQHARTHSSRVGKPNEGANAQDTILDGLTDAQLRKVPQKGMNSIAWVLWHIARSEDVGIHLFSGRKQVFEDGSWASKLRVSDKGSGSGHSPEDVSKVSAGIDLVALKDYRVAVGIRTREAIRALKPADLDTKIELSMVRKAIAAGAYGESPNVADLEKNWPTRSRAYAISIYGVTHNSSHWGEVSTIKGLVTAK